MSRARAGAGLLAWVVALGAGLRLFQAIGVAALPSPPWRLDAFGAWLATTEPTVATMALLRLLVLGLAWYLIGATTLGVIARLAGAVRLVHLADALTVPALRRLLQSALGVGLATAMVVAASPARAQPLPLKLLESAEPSTDDRPATGDTRFPTLPTVRPHRADVAIGPPTMAPTREEYTVVAGDSFWRIAADRLEVAGHAPATDADIAVYWRRLIDDNRDRLADPGNPDLLFPGQQLVLPPVA